MLSGCRTGRSVGRHVHCVDKAGTCVRRPALPRLQECLLAARSAATCKRTWLSLASRSSHPRRHPCRCRDGRPAAARCRRRRTAPSVTERQPGRSWRGGCFRTKAATRSAPPTWPEVVQGDHLGAELRDSLTPVGRVSEGNVYCDAGAARLRRGGGQLSRACIARSSLCRMSRCEASAGSTRRNVAAWIAAPRSPRR